MLKFITHYPHALFSYYAKQAAQANR